MDFMNAIIFKTMNKDRNRKISETACIGSPCKNWCVSGCGEVLASSHLLSLKVATNELFVK